MSTQVLLHGCCLETERCDLESFVACGVSGTFDMGTEVGLMDFMATDVQCVLPGYARTEDLDDDRYGGDVGETSRAEDDAGSTNR